MKLSVYSIEKTLFDGMAKSLTAKTTTGEITVLDNHLPLVSVVRPGKIYYTNLQNEEQELFIPGGILEVRPAIERNSPERRLESEVVVLANPN